MSKGFSDMKSIEIQEYDLGEEEKRDEQLQMDQEENDQQIYTERSEGA